MHSQLIDSVAKIYNSALKCELLVICDPLSSTFQMHRNNYGNVTAFSPFSLFSNWSIQMDGCINPHSLQRGACSHIDPAHIYIYIYLSVIYLEYSQVCCSGHGKNGALCVLQRSIRPEVMTQVCIKFFPFLFYMKISDFFPCTMWLQYAFLCGLSFFHFLPRFFFLLCHKNVLSLFIFCK